MMLRLLRVFRSVAFLLVGYGAMTLPGCARNETTDVSATASKSDGDSGEKTSDVDTILRQAVKTEPEETIRFVTPEGWVPTEGSGLQKASFEVQEGTLSAEVSAMGVPGAATQLLPNVNLWRKQVGLGDATQEQLDAELKPIEIGGRSGHYIHLIGPAEAERPVGMLAALISHQDRTWFFKMLGDVELVERQQDRFEEFLRSVTFGPGGGDENE